MNSEIIEVVEKPSIYEKLSMIQNEMKVPKNLYNSFGKYNYRNAETILETAKPICAKHRTTLVIGDSIEVKENGWTYVKSIATLYDWDSREIIENVAYAREPLEKKGMDSSQVTGATSSYCRKYCLNGLFCLDDVKDADADEVSPDAKGSITDKQCKMLVSICEDDRLNRYLEHFKCDSLYDLSMKQASAIIEKVKSNGTR